MNKKKVLIIDDEPDTVTYLCTWLEDHGYETCSALDGEEGLGTIREQQPDLVLLDLQMPNHSGAQVYKSLRSDEAFKHLPVIFITGATEFQTFDDDCVPLPEPAARIEKPIDMEALHEAIKTALQDLD